ncbi:hypothetical protein [Leptothrix discophora]|uniref:Uncharacterized protein n=1 Tax=Leptothrix discophora TaxID=89 RepID=A0ABT9FXP2_LEPDI|nr:hypothetical protein [Leptothrix discophora]MDP4299005.1 hypothetical protein [Leptothrix discophora]
MPITLAHADADHLRRLSRAGAGDSWRVHAAPVPDHNVEFKSLQDAYRSRGGIARGEALAQRMSLTGTGGYVDLARRLVAREVFSFQWQEDFWLPMFQFDPVLLQPRAPTAQVLAALGASHDAADPAHRLDGWALARWFVTPLAALDGATPLARIDVDLGAVLAVATDGSHAMPTNARGRSS